jgi:hypothetical protein
MRSFFNRDEADSTEEAEPFWKRQARNVIETQIARYPFLVQSRAVWNQLQDEREHWLVLIPALVVVAIMAYRNERRRLRDPR